MKKVKGLPFAAIAASIALAACSSPIETNAGFGGQEASRGLYYYNAPCTIQAEHYSDASGIQVGNNTALNVSSVGWIDSGDWLDYGLNVPTAGEYTFEFAVASAVSTGQFDVQFDGQTIRRTDSNAHWGIARIDVPNTGGWDNWTVLTMKSNLTAGRKALRIWAGGAGFNLDSIRVTPSAGVTSRFVLPARVEPETFIVQTSIYDTLVARVSQDGTGYATMNYRSKFGTARLTFTVVSQSAREYAVTYRTSSSYDAHLLLSIDAVAQAPIDLPATGSYDGNWTTTTTKVTLPAGEHVVSIESYGTSFGDGAGFSLDSVTFAESTANGQ